jgi:hypothetical protein
MPQLKKKRTYYSIQQQYRETNDGDLHPKQDRTQNHLLQGEEVAMAQGDANLVRDLLESSIRAREHQ